MGWSPQKPRFLSNILAGQDGLSCPALRPALPCPVLSCRAGQTKNFRPALQGRTGQGGRAAGQPCPDDGL